MWRITTLLLYSTIHLSTTEHSPLDPTVPGITQSPGSHTPSDHKALGSNNPGSLHIPVDLITITITMLLSQSSGSTVPWIKSPYQPQVLDPHSLLDRLSLLDLLRLLALQSSGSTVFLDLLILLYNEWYITNHWSGCLQGIDQPNEDWNKHKIN